VLTGHKFSLFKVCPAPGKMEKKFQGLSKQFGHPAHEPASHWAMCASSDPG